MSPHAPSQTDRDHPGWDHARKEDEEHCLAAGMDAHISKPIDFQNCLQVIGDIIKYKSSGGG